MPTFNIHARYVHLDNAIIRTSQYADGSPALLADGVIVDDGVRYLDTETLSVNLSGYGIDTPADHVYVPAWSEHEGLPEALVEAGIATLVEAIKVGPFDAPVALMKLNEGVVS